MMHSIMLNKKTLEKVLAVAVALLIWQAAAMLLSADFLLASPLQVARRLIKLLLAPKTYGILWYSFYHITAGFLLGSAVGVLLAVAAARKSFIESLLWPLMITVKTVPVVSFIILSYIIMSARTLPVFISFLIVLPVIYNNVLTGIKSTPKKQTEMAAVFSLSQRKRLLYIWMPQVKPFLISGCRSAVGLAFKSGIAAEVIAIVAGSIGEQLYSGKLYFESDALLGWTLLIVLISVAVERLFMLILTRTFARLERL